MDTLLREPRFDYLTAPDKAFILAFDAEMTRLGFDAGGKIGSGYCWGHHMLIYRKTGVKSQNVYARIYFQEAGIVLRLFLNDVDKHRVFIENAPAHVKEVFTGPAAGCNHDRDDGGGRCQFRKTYTLEGRLIEKCSGIAFEFRQPSLARLPDYIALFEEFFARKRKAKVG